MLSSLDLPCVVTLYNRDYYLLKNSLIKAIQLVLLKASSDEQNPGQLEKHPFSELLLKELEIFQQKSEFNLSGYL